MTQKVLVTCPPMLEQISLFNEEFDRLGYEVTAPSVVQTLSVDELLELVPDHHGWIIGDDPATEQVFAAGKSGKLRAAVKWGIGVDNIDFAACERLEIPICNTPAMFGAEVADLAMCYLLGLARDAFYIDREVRAGGWPKPSGVSLAGKTLGIIGFGDIGQNIARRAIAHDLHIMAWDPIAESAPDYVELHKEFPIRASNCDFLVFACSLTSENYHLLNESSLGRLKRGVRIVNVSRGQLIDESVLMNGLTSGVVSSAALDVHEVEPLNEASAILKHPKCIVGSHNASNTTEAVSRASFESIRLLSEMFAALDDI